MTLHNASTRILAWGLAGIALSLLSTTAFTGTASAQSWQTDFDAAVGSLPSAQGWTHFLSDPAPDDGLTEGNYGIFGGALTQGGTQGINVDPDNRQWYEIEPVAFEFLTSTIVLDLRLKILASTMTPPPNVSARAGFSVVVRDDGGYFLHLYVGTTGFFLKGIGQSSSSAFVNFDTTADSADYQLRIDPEGASIRLNGVEVATLDREKFIRGTRSPMISFGDDSFTDYSSSQVELIRLSRFNLAMPEVRNYQTVTEYSNNDSAATKGRTVSCPPFTNALGGGVSTSGADGSVAITMTRPTGGPPATAWRGEAQEISATTATWQLRVDVICGEVPGYRNLSLTGPSLVDADQSATLGCPDGTFLIGGGAAISGASLGQALMSSHEILPFPPGTPRLWSTRARDNGATTSSSAWNMEVDAICIDVKGIEVVNAASPLDGLSPKESTVNCPTGKYPISGGAAIGGNLGIDGGLRFSRPKDDVSGGPPVGWIASGQSDSSLWSLVASVACAPISDPTVSKPGLVGRWEGESGAYDSWGRGHGILRNGASFEPGMQGFGFSLDAASDQWVEVPTHLPSLDYQSSFDLYPEGSFAVDAWIRTDTLDPDFVSEIVNVVDSGGPNVGGANSSRWGLRLTVEGFAAGYFAHSIGSVTSRPPNGTVNLADDELHHIAMVRNKVDQRLQLYIDGILKGEEALSSTINAGPLFPAAPNEPMAIGVWRIANTTDLRQGFTGMIDDVKFYDRHLTREEIQNIAGCGRAIVPRVLNLDAALFASPSNADHTLCVFLEAGDYRATLVDPTLNSDARLTAWSASQTASWSTRYSVEGEVDPGTSGGLVAFASTPEQAFDDTVNKIATFSLSVDQRVQFSIVDPTALDNRGGVSLLLEAVPEPSMLPLLGSGLMFLAAMGSARERRGSSSTALDG